MLYRLSRFSTTHKILRHIAYAILVPLPMALKFPIIHAVLHRRLPYRVIPPGSSVVQIGAPWDILQTGRSRFMHFARAVGPTGRVVVLEPETRSAAAVREYCKINGLDNVTLVQIGAWSCRDRLRFLENPNHPAANLVESVRDPLRNDLASFNVTEIEVDTLDHILANLGVVDPWLVSITSNGSENEILAGMKKTATKLRYIATIGAECKYPLLQQYGFSRYGGDDRGYTFERT